jgi:hypothetical protein
MFRFRRSYPSRLTVVDEEKIKRDALEGLAPYRVVQLPLCERWVAQERRAMVSDGAARICWRTLGANDWDMAPDAAKFPSKKEAEDFLNRWVNPDSTEYDCPPLVERKKENTQ